MGNIINKVHQFTSPVYQQSESDTGRVKASGTATDVVPAHVAACKSRSLSEEVELNVLIYVISL